MVQHTTVPGSSHEEHSPQTRSFGKIFCTTLGTFLFLREGLGKFEYVDWIKLAFT